MDCLDFSWKIKKEEEKKTQTPLQVKEQKFWPLPLNVMPFPVLQQRSCRWTDSSDVGSCKAKSKPRSPYKQAYAQA